MTLSWSTLASTDSSSVSFVEILLDQGFGLTLSMSCGSRFIWLNDSHPPLPNLRVTYRIQKTNSINSQLQQQTLSKTHHHKLTRNHPKIVSPTQMTTGLLTGASLGEEGCLLATHGVLLATKQQVFSWQQPFILCCRNVLILIL